jgi:uncharacterized protein (DUF433 family)
LRQNDWGRHRRLLRSTHGHHRGTTFGQAHQANRVSGTPCFYGTRVPIKTLFDCVASGQTLEEFLDDFEGVSREQAQAILELAGSHLLNELPKP